MVRRISGCRNRWSGEYQGVGIGVSSGADPCSTLGGIIPHFYRFFGILKFWGGYSGFADFSSFNDFENLGVYSGFNENVLKQLKTRIRMHKINK